MIGLVAERGQAGPGICRPGLKVGKEREHGHDRRCDQAKPWNHQPATQAIRQSIGAAGAWWWIVAIAFQCQPDPETQCHRANHQQQPVDAIEAAAHFSLPRLAPVEVVVDLVARFGEAAGVTRGVGGGDFIQQRGEAVGDDQAIAARRYGTLETESRILHFYPIRLDGPVVRQQGFGDQGQVVVAGNAERGRAHRCFRTAQLLVEIRSRDIGGVLPGFLRPAGELRDPVVLDGDDAVVALVILDLHRRGDLQAVVIACVEIQVTLLQLLETGCRQGVAHGLGTLAFERRGHRERHRLFESAAGIEARLDQSRRCRLAAFAH